MDIMTALSEIGLAEEVQGKKGAEFLQQAEKLWTLLDDMVDNDPDAYKCFINKQIQDHRQLTTPPTPEMCVHAMFKVSPRFMQLQTITLFNVMKRDANLFYFKFFVLCNFWYSITWFESISIEKAFVAKLNNKTSFMPPITTHLSGMCPVSVLLQLETLTPV